MYTARMNPTIQSLREDATAAFHAAVAAVQPANLVPNAVKVEDGTVSIWGEPIAEVAGRHVVVALGKAASTLTDAWLELLPDWADQLFVLTPHNVPVSERVSEAAELCRGSHPYPDGAGEGSTRRLLELAGSLGEDDLLMVLLSGGSSALLAATEEGLTLDDLRATTKTRRPSSPKSTGRLVGS